MPPVDLAAFLGKSVLGPSLSGNLFGPSLDGQTLKANI